MEEQQESLIMERVVAYLRSNGWRYIEHGYYEHGLPAKAWLNVRQMNSDTIIERIAHFEQRHADVVRREIGSS